MEEVCSALLPAQLIRGNHSRSRHLMIKGKRVTMHTMSLLQEGGMVMFNHLYLTSADKLHAQHYFESVFSKEVMAPQMMELRTNAMLVGYRHTSP